jgi:tricorn protease
LQVKVEPRQEWAQIFDEVWRINRDFFYAPNMHGADWKAMKAKYGAFLPDLATRADLNRVIQWLCSELAVGHHRGGGGDLPDAGKALPGGLLGADLAAANGRYQFTKIFGGLNWSPELRSPLTEPGVNVKPGEYLLAVNGRDLKAPENLYARFENTAGKLVELTVGGDPTGKGARTVSVVPVENEAGLRNRDWVEGNLRKVSEATEGRVAYVYVPNTTALGHTYFKRYFYPQAQKDAVIIDERYNGGGQVADYYIDLLRRPFIAMWAMRYGQDLKSPQASIQGPKVMLVDETAGSGGDLLPWMFRKFNLGPLVGRPTWGGLVGILGFPTLMDGGNITAPNLAIWTEKGWVVENEGVAPDIEVEQLPKDVIAGRDPQLEKAIELMKAELKKNPPQKLVRPPYPVRTK